MGTELIDVVIDAQPDRIDAPGGARRQGLESMGLPAIQQQDVARIEFVRHARGPGLVLGGTTQQDMGSGLIARKAYRRLIARRVASRSAALQVNHLQHLA